MGIVENPEVNDQQKIIPVIKDNLKLMSFGFISGNQAPVVWRGPLVAKMTEQFFRDVVWGELDYLILDLPPGTGDVQLTLSQKIPLDGAIIVTTPNDIALTGDEDTVLEGSFDGSDIEGDDLTYTVVDQPSNGTITIDGSTVQFDPNNDWNGTDTFTYKANDGELDSNTATVTVTVNAVNDAPISNDVSLPA